MKNIIAFEPNSTESTAQIINFPLAFLQVLIDKTKTKPELTLGSLLSCTLLHDALAKAINSIFTEPQSVLRRYLTHYLVTHTFR